VRETLNRYTELSPFGGLNVSRIQEILGNTAGSGSNESSKVKVLSPESRQQFLHLALALHEQDG
jgi:hypothetical protein